MDLLTATNHAAAYEWAAVFMAHFALGLVLAAVAAAILDAIDGFAMSAGDTAPFLVTWLYLIAWEMGVQRLGAGWGDAIVDTAAIAAGAFAGLFLWRRDGAKVAATIAAAAAILLRGIWRRK